MNVNNHAEEASLAPTAVTNVGADAPRQTDDGGRDIKGVESPVSTEIYAAIDVVDLANLKTTRISHRTARAFRVATASCSM